MKKTKKIIAIYLSGFLQRIVLVLNPAAGSIFTNSTFHNLSSLPFWTLMFGTGKLGGGFGFTITAPNPFAFLLFPGNEDSAVTGIYVFLGIGTTSSALVLNGFKAEGIW